VDPVVHFTLFQISWHDGTSLDCILPEVEAQVRLPLVSIDPMAIKTIFRENRPDIPIEIQGLRKNHQGHAKHKKIWKQAVHCFQTTPLVRESQLHI